MTNLALARAQMAYSLGFHMLFASLGVGMPLMMAVAEGLWLKTREERYLKLAKTWSKATGVLFALGAVSGTALSFELGLLWPRFMGFAGATVGPAFALEGFAFFMEAIFIGLYLYGWERLSPVAHWLSGIVVAVSGAASSALVVATHAWMQNPQGADLLRTNPEAVDVGAVLFQNPAWGIMTLHSTAATYAATGFAVAGVYAWSLLRSRSADRLRLTGLKLALAVGLLGALTMPVTGHVSAQFDAARQPVKLAAMESQFRTETGAPLRIGGIPDEAGQKVRFAIEIPGALSWLAFGNWDAKVAGLDQVPPADWPSVPVVHFAFQIMVAAGIAMLLIALGYFWTITHRQGPSGALLKALIAASPLGFIALEAGWVVTEVGRQPWIIYGVMRTSEAVTPAAGLPGVFAGFLALYAMLGVVMVLLLARLRHT